jgi:hypothetical protein
VSRPTPLSGFPELLPAQRLAEQLVLDSLRRVFELHGFAPLETRAVETLEQLTRKGEIDKEVYVLRRLHAADDAGDSGLGLHFDLTVPLRALRPGARRAAGVPLPPLPDPEGPGAASAHRRAASVSSPKPTSTSSAGTPCPSQPTWRWPR